jgi:hypothetical protein
MNWNALWLILIGVIVLAPLAVRWMRRDAKW